MNLLVGTNNIIKENQYKHVNPCQQLFFSYSEKRLYLCHTVLHVHWVYQHPGDRGYQKEMDFIPSNNYPADRSISLNLPPLSLHNNR